MTENTHDTETSNRASTKNYGRIWKQYGIDPKVFGLSSHSSPPRVTDIGVVIIARWQSDKAKVTLYRGFDDHHRVKITTQSGKTYTALISHLDLPYSFTIADACERACQKGFLRLRKAQ